MITAITLSVFISLFFLLLSAGVLREPEKVNVTERLRDLYKDGTSDGAFDIRDAELQKSIVERMILPSLKKANVWLNKIMPSGMIENLQPKLNAAGNPRGLSAGEFLTLKLLGIILCGIAVTPVLFNDGLGRFLLYLTGGALFFWILPDLYLKSLADKRTREIEKSMPDILDLLTVSVEAGYGWDAALLKVSEKRKGPLAEEFQRVAKEVKMGKPRRDAMRDLAERINNDSVTTFVTAVIQADQLGLSLGKVLRSQSDQIRHKRRQEVEEAAMKAPIKMLIPMIIFIFPVVFIILLGPAVIMLIEVLG